MMNQLKYALEQLDTTIDRLEVALDARLGQFEGALQDTRSELSAANSKVKQANRIGERLDDIIAEVREILAVPDAATTPSVQEQEQ